LKRAGETAAFGLRMTAGWPFEEFRRVTNFDLRNEWDSEMKQLVERGWGTISPDNFRLTKTGLRFATRQRKCFCDRKRAVRPRTNYVGSRTVNVVPMPSCS